jgi:hypothetical protein
MKLTQLRQSLGYKCILRQTVRRKDPAIDSSKMGVKFTNTDVLARRVRTSTPVAQIIRVQFI